MTMDPEDICSDCQKPFAPDDYVTEVNPEGGYGMHAVIVCDACMRKPFWDHWKSQHWVNWPELPRETN
jgi:hypothetical protein